MSASNPDVCSSAAAFAPRLRELHQESNVLVLANAWDVMSALVIANEGAGRSPTTSGGVSWADGQPDGQHLDPSRAVRAVSAIVARSTSRCLLISRVATGERPTR